jgi:magnesium chelatase accessory protein
VRLALVYSEADAAVPASVARDVAKRVPDAELIPMSGLGHLAHEEDPQAFVDIVRRVWRTQAG